MKPDLITIRPMQLEDVAEVRRIDLLSFSMPWPESAYRYELTENKASRSFVAEITTPAGEKVLAGMIVVWLVIDEAHIATIAVHPDFRGLEIGKKLLVTGLETAIQLGMEQITLEVRAGNGIAQSLYRQFGFDQVGLRPHYYRDNQEDALIMTVSSKTAARLIYSAAKFQNPL